jgi:hypothetical protein
MKRGAAAESARGQSFGFVAELPLGPELALLPLNHREFIARRTGRKAGGKPEGLALLAHSCRGETKTELPSQ